MILDNPWTLLDTEIHNYEKSSERAECGGPAQGLYDKTCLGL